MIRIQQLKVQGFRSFEDERTFVFPDRPGFFHLKGANGAGKSSLWDAVSWCLFGKTARGLKGSDAKNWSGTLICATELRLTINKQPVVIQRTQSPNALTIQEGNEKQRPVTQEQIEELVGFNHSMFLTVTLMGQFNQFFFDLSPAEKLQAFGESLGLQYWTERADRVRSQAKDAQQGLTSTTALRNQETGRLETLQKRRAVLLTRLEEVVQQHAEQNKDIQQQIDEVKQEFYQTNKELTKHIQLKSKCDEKERNANKELINIHREVERITKKLNDINRQSDLVIHRMRERERLRERIQTERVCSQCLQRVDENHRSKHLKEIRQANEADQTVLTEREERTNRLERKTRRLKQQMVELDKGLNRVREDRQGHDNRVRELGQQKRTLQFQLDALRQGLKNDPTQPIKAELETLTIEIKGSKTRSKELEVEEREITQRIEGLQRWQVYFRELRLWLADEATKQLEVEVNNHLTELGLEGWRIECVVEKETKGGTTSRGFHVLVQSPESHQQPRRWESWSGGETQRLRVAGALGLASLVRHRHPTSDLGFEVWDEPTQGMNEDGIDQLLTFFADRSRSDGKQVWLIDHRTLKAGDFDGEVLVTKGERGSELVMTLPPKTKVSEQRVLGKRRRFPDAK